MCKRSASQNEFDVDQLTLHPYIRYGPMNGASAMAANGIFRYTLGAIFPLFTVQSMPPSYHGAR